MVDTRRFLFDVHISIPPWWLGGSLIRKITDHVSGRYTKRCLPAHGYISSIRRVHYRGDMIISPTNGHTSCRIGFIGECTLIIAGAHLTVEVSMVSIHGLLIIEPQVMIIVPTRYLTMDGFEHKQFFSSSKFSNGSSSIGQGDRITVCFRVVRFEHNRFVAVAVIDQTPP